MQASEVRRVVEALDEGGVAAGLTGGWGIDALLGRQTRRHGDVDLGVPAPQIEQAITALERIGYVVAIDQRPARLELRGPHGGVDLHPIEWAADGSGTQRGFEGRTFTYPPGSLSARGRVDGREVACATPELQVAFHLGYEPSGDDHRDMSALAAAFGIRLPAPYRMGRGGSA